MVAFSLVVSLLLVAVDAFRPTFRARGVSSLQMVLVDPETWPGQSAPVRNINISLLPLPPLTIPLSFFLSLATLIR